MRKFARPLTSLARLRATAARGWAFATALTAVTVTLALAAPPAGAIVTTVEGTQVGLQPREPAPSFSKSPFVLVNGGLVPETFNNEHGNVVLHGTNEYAIYWDPNDQFHHEWLVNIDTFFHELGEAGLGTPFADLGDFRDRSNTVAPFRATYMGSYSDTAKFPSGCKDSNPLQITPALERRGVHATCITDAQLREQLSSFIAFHGLPRGLGTIYFVILPPAVTLCLNASATHCSDYKLSEEELEEEKRESTSYEDSFCSYHGDINPDNAPEGDGNTILFAAIPWSAGEFGLADYRAANEQYEKGFDCQDGGWSAEKNKETFEQVPPLTAEEKTALEKEPPEKRKEKEEARALAGPHQEEPNQEGKGESGDASPGLSDLLINQISEEEMDTVSDPLMTSWQDSMGDEATDLCRNTFANTNAEGVLGSATANLETKAGFLANAPLGNQHFYINNIWTIGFEHCEGAVGLVPRFNTPDPVNNNEIVGFDGMESTVSLIKGEAFGVSGPPTTTYSKFKWNFGDGTPEVEGYAPGAPECEAPWLSPCAASTFHSYQYGGSYQVTLTITDVAGNEGSVSHTITVVGPPNPNSAGGAPGASGKSGAGSGPALPTPIAAALIVHQSLRSALRKGLVVSYSVNEQVAGHFEVLISSALARRLHISGTPAKGLAPGSPAETVIAKAILVTTKGGHNAVHILFSKRTAARLAHMHKVALMVRLSVRNASPSYPATATVVTTATLAG